MRKKMLCVILLGGLIFSNVAFCDTLKNIGSMNENKIATNGDKFVLRLFGYTLATAGVAIATSSLQDDNTVGCLAGCLLSAISLSVVQLEIDKDNQQVMAKASIKF